MPKIVDHDARRRELAEAVWRVIARDGVDAVSIRAVAAAAGWSTGALRYYFTTRAELLAFACEQVIDRVTERIEGMDRIDNVPEWVRAVLRETMPLDERRHIEASIAFSFVALGLADPELARVQRRQFTSMRALCERVVELLTGPDADRERLAARLHALVDGLSLQGLAGFSTPEQMGAELDAYLDDITE
ncbi:TetR family transcriptional regulator [Nocardia sp. CDC159]|uniref:TetR family transcriptional regulator n=1 Tax=Nocardia pulmonis TaxID=2951408 RepID=A0A9X2IYH6_9NOCA|nr:MULTISPECIES: TetR/AcrR family transcriptional regulator [Nocardia]MCM6776408.1 TetR family transcriptional regulator [Nocardia pulmonis]MCM6788832.1 TetR family transcriptional regulator [Nocardia sp. CDC159]